MKNQYFGDIGDYGKYALLRHLADAGIGVGINWYLTDGDDSNDGKMTKYLKSEDSSLRSLDEGLFDSLRRLVIIEKRRNVKASEKEALINNAIYFHDILDIKDKGSIAEKRLYREEWHNRAMSALKAASLIYFDPDNGIADEKVSAKKNSVKYLLTGEAADYYNAGHDIVYYCHKGRRKEKAWEDYKRILKEGKNGSISQDAWLTALTYHRGVQRTFIFAIHPERRERYETLINSFAEKWHEHFEIETIQK